MQQKPPIPTPAQCYSLMSEWELVQEWNLSSLGGSAIYPVLNATLEKKIKIKSIRDCVALPSLCGQESHLIDAVALHIYSLLLP